jgi:hypothetical protein
VKAVDETPSQGETAMSTILPLKFRASIFAAVLAIAPFSPVSRAQDVGMLAKVNVPFAFETASQHFAAGVYTIRMENEHTLLIQGKSESGLALAWVDDNAQPVQRGKAVFQKYGDQYFLSEISITGKSRRVRFRPSRAESRMQIAGSKTTPTGIEVALMDASR